VISSTTGIHCSNDRRAWTDLVTNITVLSGVDLEQHLGNFVDTGKFPHSCLPAFIHEITHHWCFQTAVGSALALLRLRARRRMLLAAAKAGGSSADIEFDVVEDMLRYEAAVAMLRPLSEGIALFAEFDVVPNLKSRFISIPFNCVYRNFTSPDLDELKQRFGFSLDVLLCNMRMHQIYIDRKSNTLLEPLTSRSGGYLAGYLVVKKLWQVLSARSEIFVDAELYFAFLRAFIYDDFGLVRVLLNEDLSEIEAVNSIATYIQTRLNQLVEDDDVVNAGAAFERSMASTGPIQTRLNQLVEDDVVNAGAAFERSMASTGPDRAHWEPEPILTEQKDHRAGKAALRGIMDELNEATADPLESALKEMDALRLAQRDVMCLGQITAQLEVLPNQRLLIHGSKRLLTAFPSRTDRDRNPENGECSVEVYISPSGLFTAITLSQNQRIIETFAPHSLVLTREEVERRLETYMVDRQRNVEQNAAEEKLLEEFVSRSSADILLTHVLENCTDIIENMYIPRALAHSQIDKEQTLRMSMAKEGFGPLAATVENLRRISALSLAASLTSDRGEIIKIMEKAGRDAEAAITICNRISIEHGLMVLLDDNNVLISLI
jgi:hypothetical protein